ncbi:MAG TPA: energy transducer TonB [Opitutaceae bacterium]|nr:energy transducer TonB [Opitutaceae bacterium]
MKAHTKLVLSLGLLALPLAAFAAKSDEQAYIESYKGRTGSPVPVTVVKPVIGSEHAGATLELEFTVDEAGKPGGITARTPADSALVEELTRAVAKWKFEPLRRDGKVVPAKVVLPVRIVDAFTSSKRLVSN